MVKVRQNNSLGIWPWTNSSQMTWQLWIGGLYECDLTECCEPHVLPYSWDVDHHHLTHHYGVVCTEALWEITMADLPTIQRWCFFPPFSLWMYPACVYRPKHDNPVQSNDVCPSTYTAICCMISLLKGTKCIHFYYHMICLLFKCAFLWHRLLYKQKWGKKTRMCIGATHTRHVSHITTVLHSNISKNGGTV